MSYWEVIESRDTRAKANFVSAIRGSRDLQVDAEGFGTIWRDSAKKPDLGRVAACDGTKTRSRTRAA
jgi:hypothetical protein